MLLLSSRDPSLPVVKRSRRVNFFSRCDLSLFTGFLSGGKKLFQRPFLPAHLEELPFSIDLSLVRPSLRLLSRRRIPFDSLSPTASQTRVLVAPREAACLTIRRLLPSSHKILCVSRLKKKDIGPSRSTRQRDYDVQFFSRPFDLVGSCVLSQPPLSRRTHPVKA